ncbi:MAG TPA: radical SAM protein [Methanoculleus sp.]|nr:radical SAM protein [Methanoculleus sp.]
MPVLSKGCRLCFRGAKMVLFITGRCGRSCWYCPISSERKGKDTAYANDREIRCDEDVLDEARIMSALGTGITGGEPFLVPERVVHYCRLLKGTFGDGHHIHIYTGIAPGNDVLDAIAGLVDEIRFHPPHEIWPDIMESTFPRAIRHARSLGMEVTVEVPSLPGIDALEPLMDELDFFNINELEWSETNAHEMRMRGLDLEDCYHNAVGGAEDWTRELRRHEKVHWCTSTFKDSIQLRERLKRIAENTARSFEEITDDGTVIYGVLECGADMPDIDPETMEVTGGRVEMAWWVLTDDFRDHPGKKYVVERYPNNGMIVEVIPL